MQAAVLAQPTLVLNRSWMAIATTSVRHALVDRAGRRRPEGADLGDALQNTPTHPLCSMPLQGVRDLVSHDGRQAGFGLGDREDAREHRNFTPRERKRIDHAIFADHDELPMIFRLIRHGRDPLTYARDQTGDLRIRHDGSGLEQFSE